MPKASKRKREESSEEEDEEEEEEQETFTVEVITEARVGHDPEDPKQPWEYHVKWAGYGSDEDTWEPESGLAACQRLLASFWHEVGEDDQDYPVGTVVKASKKWIKSERERFQVEFAKGKDEKRKQKERADRKKEEKFAAKKAAKKRKQNEATSVPSRSGSSTSVPRVTGHKSVSSYSAPLPSKKTDVVSDSSDSDDDRPLASLKKPSPTVGDKRNASASSRQTEASHMPPKAVASPQHPTPPVTSLFSPSPPPSSPEISLSSIAHQPQPAKPKPKPPTRKTSTPSILSKAKGSDRPSLSVNTSKAVPSPSLPSASKPTPRPLPKPIPLPSRQRTAGSNAGSATSSTFPTRPFGKPATPMIPSNSKPSTPTIPSTTPTIPLVKPPTPIIPSAIPAHVQRKGSAPSRGVQLINTADPSPPSSGSGLSTKQRLSQAALTLAPAKEAQKKSNLSKLNFKKKSSSSGPNLPTASGSTVRAKNPPPSKRPTKDPLFDADPDEQDFDLFEPSVDMDIDDGPSILPPALSRRPSQPQPQPDIPPLLRRPSQASLNAEADELLRDMLPAKPPTTATPSLAVEKQDVPHPPRFKPRMLPPKIQKKWKWTGKLLADLADKTDHLCDVVLTDLTPMQIEGLRINDAMASADSVHLLSFHDLVDMGEFLKSCEHLMTCVRLQSPEPSQQLARLSPSADKDSDPLKILARYMTKKSLVSLVPIILDDRLAGHLLLFPPFMKILIELFRVPAELAKNSSLVVALLPWKEIEGEYRRPFSQLPARLQPPVPLQADWRRNMENSKYQLALRILKFPSTLHEWMSKSHRPYCIWPPSGDQKAPCDSETAYLMAILTRCGAKKVSFKADFRAIFVHVGALRNIRKLPLLVERRSQTCSIRFYTYGTHETVHPEHWGIREIYPVGGVVTFTPSALYEDPWGVVNTMKLINKHPLWTCYILPSVLGMATKLSSPDEDPLAAFDRGVFVFDVLLRAIDDGEVSVLRAPPLDRYPLKESDAAADWLRDHWITRPIGPRRMLESCMNTFSAKYSNVPQAEWFPAIETEISDDLDTMQRQPDIMKQYRRYAVIRAESDNSVNADRDGFEWVTNSSFSFNDDSQKLLTVV